ncbi:MAG: hypothetical protein DYG92_01625 [Leptolyngbya sp. PLA1]|nr:hypothetical protein [Leptolyngbya sp. PLA1]
MRRRAFTLFETLLAIVLIVALSAAVFGFLWTLLERREQLDTVGARGDGLAAMWSRLERDLATTFAADGAGGAGLRGDSSSLRVRARGVGLDPSSRASEATGSEFVFSASTGQLTGRTIPGPGATAEVLATGLELVRFRYHDGAEWRESFDSGSARALPLAVEVSVWFGAGPAAARAVPPDDIDLVGREDGPARPADRTRVITIPDGPVSAWKEGA